MPVTSAINENVSRIYYKTWIFDSLFLVSEIICEKFSIFFLRDITSYIRHFCSSFLTLKLRNDTRKLLSPYLHFTWSATYCSQGYTIAKLPLSPQLQTIGKALLANYASNNSPVHWSRHRNWWKCSVEFLSVCQRRTATSSPFTKLLSQNVKLSGYSEAALLKRSSRLLETIHVSIATAA